MYYRFLLLNIFDIYACILLFIVFCTIFVSKHKWLQSGTYKHL